VICLSKSTRADFGEEATPITLIDEDGREHEFQMVDLIKVKGSDYVVLAPLEDDDDEHDLVERIVVLRLETDGEDSHVLTDIDDEDEWDQVERALEELIVDRFPEYAWGGLDLGRRDDAKGLKH